MNSHVLGAIRSVGQMVLNGRSSHRSIAAAVKLCGRRLERRWPFLPSADTSDLNLGFDDLLEFQYARRRDFNALVVGAYDGLENDPSQRFIASHECRVVFVEPQPGPCARLRNRSMGRPGVEIVNAAIDRHTGTRELYCVKSDTAELPKWVEQIASFRREHLLKHESDAPGLSAHIEARTVRTITFDDLLNEFELERLDLLQIDAEGMDADMLSWFPFQRIKPSLLHYEVAHMSAIEHHTVSERLKGMGYTILPSDSLTDEVAVLI